MCPHDPATFNRSEGKGFYLPESAFDVYGTEAILDYCNDINIIDSMIGKLVDDILSFSTKPPVIIIQSDHGSYTLGPVFFSGEKFAGADRTVYHKRAAQFIECVVPTWRRSAHGLLFHV